MIARMIATIPWRKWPLLLEWIRAHHMYRLAKPISVLGQPVTDIDIVHLHEARFHAPDSTYDVVVDVWEQLHHDTGVIMVPPELLIDLRQLLRDEKAVAA